MFNHPSGSFRLSPYQEFLITELANKFSLYHVTKKCVPFYRVTVLTCYHIIVLLCYYVTTLLCYCVRVFTCYRVIVLQFYLVNLLPKAHKLFMPEPEYSILL
jgi:hypothetical protein